MPIHTTAKQHRIDHPLATLAHRHDRPRRSDEREKLDMTLPIRLARLASTLASTMAPILLAALFAASPASAQLWDWGGGGEVNGSGRTEIKFSPQYKPGQIIVSFGDKRLYYISGIGQAISYPIAIPRQQSRWQGVMAVSEKRVNPSWTPTPDMFKENPKLPPWVPGGHPMNPLGVRALYLGSSAYRIHGTDAPWTIGQPVSKGCVRLYNKDIIDLYNRTPLGTKVTVTYQHFTTAA
jgi:lipoprotein-anchoring transpeptidase ErfK/SrfK